jgi:hypothetical protein
MLFKFFGDKCNGEHLLNTYYMPVTLMNGSKIPLFNFYHNYVRWFSPKHKSRKLKLREAKNHHI